MSNNDIPEVPKLISPFSNEVTRDTRQSRPWDLFNKNIGRVEDSIQKERMSICIECPELIKLTKQCKKCGCFMEAKTRLPNAECPIGKWNRVEIDESTIDYK